MSSLTLLAIFSACCLVSFPVAHFTKRLGLPATVIELIFGVVIGNYFLTSAATKAADGISDLGSLALFFLVGLHTDIKVIKPMKRDILTVVSIGGILSLFSAPILQSYFNLTLQESLFATASIMATGVGVVMRVLQEYKAVDKPMGRFLIACLVMEDLPAILLFSLTAALTHTAGVSANGAMAALMEKITIVAACIGIAWFAARKGMLPAMPAHIIFPVLVITAWGTDALGFTSLLGAALVGLACASNKKAGYDSYIAPAMDFFIPIFFLTAGMRIKMETLTDIHSWQLAAALSVIAFTSKACCFLGIRKSTRKQGIDPWTVACGLLPRGLPGLAFATIALHAGYITDTLYAAMVIMITLTNVVGMTSLAYRLRDRGYKEVGTAEAIEY